MLSEANWSKLESIADEICERENCRVYDIEVVGDGRGRVVRVFIDKTGVEGVSIDDCSNVSRGLSLRLDVEDIIPGEAYNLEVSSPGLDRILRKPWHYETVLGQDISVKLTAPIAEFATKEEAPASWQKRRQFQSKLNSVAEDGFIVAIDKEEVKVPYEFVEKAKAVVDLGDIEQKKGPKPKKSNKPKKKAKRKK